MMDEMTLTLSSPITEEQFDAITDVDFDNTDRIWFHTKHGNDVEFVKRKKGCKIVKSTGYYGYCACDQCGKPVHPEDLFCSKCGADFRKEDT